MKLNGKGGSIVKGCAAALIALLALRILLWLLPCAALKQFMQRENSTRFYDRNGVLLQVRPLEEGLRREYYPLKDIPEAIGKAFIAAEDKNFYLHPGVDFFSIVRAFMQNRRAGHTVSGASTITMQLVRLIYPRTGRATVRTKFVEMLRAFRIEAKLSKHKILELYLNNLPFGFQVEGIGSAARAFYGVTPDKLTDEQIARLALIPRRPVQYAPEKSFVYPNLCPHFIRHVEDEYRTQGKRLPDALTLSIDSALVTETEKNIQKKISEFKDSRIHNGAALALDNLTGEILVWAGNASFDDSAHSGQIDGVLVQNQPGSSMKPFLYALALEHGFSPADSLPDIPQDFGSFGVYVPLNFNNCYNGPVRFRVALASSLNVPAVYLLHELGMESYLSCLQALGFASLAAQKDSLGLSLALGGADVSLYEMARAFSVFPNDGVLHKNTILKASGKPGGSGGGSRVYQADTARVLCDILSDKNARELGFGHARVFDTPYPAIFKTGTSNQFQNIIALGATSRVTVGVWMGNFEGQTVVGKTGSSIPAEIVRALLDELTKRYGADDFLQPEDYRKERVCALSGLAAGPACPATAEEYVRATRDSCTWHSLQGGLVQVQYPSEYQHWAHSRNFAGSIAGNSARLQIVYPRNGAVFIYDPTLPASVQMLQVQAVGGAAESASLYADGELVGTASGVLSWNLPLARGTHTIAVECAGEESVSSFTVK